MLACSRALLVPPREKGVVHPLWCSEKEVLKNMSWARSRARGDDDFSRRSVDQHCISFGMWNGTSLSNRSLILDREQRGPLLPTLVLAMVHRLSQVLTTLAPALTVSIMITYYASDLLCLSIPDFLLFQKFSSVMASTGSSSIVSLAPSGHIAVTSSVGNATSIA